MNKSKINKKDANWEKLFEEHRILAKIERKGFFHISSDEINKYRESRLMTNFDHKTSLPKLFKDNGLSILPITRGSYVIAQFEAYHELCDDKSLEKDAFDFPEGIESINRDNLYSESASLHCAHVCGIIDDLMGEEAKHTVSGRMSTSSFQFSVQDNRCKRFELSVENSQCEIDGGFESANKLMIIEAKNFAYEDFLIRQLYYPYRLWVGKISKEVVPVFMTYSNDVFHFFVFRFTDLKSYNSIELVEQKKYILSPETITLNDIEAILESVKIVSEPEVPFPQADSFERVIDLLGLLMEKDLTKDEITNNYLFDKRQSDYYVNSVIYLNLAERKKKDKVTVYCISPLGKEIMSKAHKQKLLRLVQQVLKHEPFNRVLELSLKKAALLTKDETCSIMKDCNLYKVGTDKTYGRRASTVVRWIDWILGLQDV
jgi:hypothetical protein